MFSLEALPELRSQVGIIAIDYTEKQAVFFFGGQPPNPRFEVGPGGAIPILVGAGFGRHRDEIIINAQKLGKASEPGGQA